MMRSAAILAAALCAGGCVTQTAADGDGDGEPQDGVGGPNEQPRPQPSFLPEPHGECPVFADGELTFDAKSGKRKVQIWLGDADATPGALLFFWHGTSRTPRQVEKILGESVMGTIRESGGMVASPFHVAEPLPWWLTTGTLDIEDDVEVADEVLACAIEQGLVDTSRIHSMGHSAGALHTTEMSFRRSGYLASVVTVSGGLTPVAAPPDQDPTNPFAALIFHGGDDDFVGVHFPWTSEDYRDALEESGRFGLLCNHNNGHEPPGDSLGPLIGGFIEDHPFGTSPSPYAIEIPAEFGDMCD